MGRLIAALALLLTACSPPTWTEHATAPTVHRVPTVVDSAFTPDEQATIQDAAHIWERATGGQIQFRVEVRPVDIIADVHQPLTLVLCHRGHTWIPAGTCGWSRDYGTGARVVHLVAGECLTVGHVAHEFGHALGAPHSNGTMAPSGGDCPDRESVERVAERWGLDRDALGWCE